MHYPVHWEFEAIGTKWKIDCVVPLGVSVDELSFSIHDRIKVFDHTYSRFLPDTLISRMSISPGVYEFPKEAEILFSLYDDLFDLTGGAVTPLIGNVLHDAGYDATYSFSPREIRPLSLWDKEVKRKGNTLKIKKPLIIDVGAAGKGYLVDLVGDLLCSRGVCDWVIDAGGDILHHTTTQHSLRIGLEDPRDSSQVIGVATIRNASICGSATNRRAWGAYHHIIDGRSMRPVKDISAVWVIAESGIIADALSTALFFVSSQILLSRYSFEYLQIYADGHFDASSRFPGELFTSLA